MIEVKLNDCDQSTGMYFAIKDGHYVSFGVGGASYDVEIRVVTPDEYINVGCTAKTFDGLVEALRAGSDWKMEFAEGMTHDLSKPFNRIDRMKAAAIFDRLNGSLMFTASDGANPDATIRIKPADVPALLDALEKLVVIVPADTRKLLKELDRDDARALRYADRPDFSYDEPGDPENRVLVRSLIAERRWTAAFHAYYDWQLSAERRGNRPSIFDRKIDPASAKIILDALKGI